MAINMTNTNLPPEEIRIFVDAKLLEQLRCAVFDSDKGCYLVLNQSNKSITVWTLRQDEELPKVQKLRAKTPAIEGVIKEFPTLGATELCVIGSLMACQVSEPSNYLWRLVESVLGSYGEYFRDAEDVRHTIAYLCNCGILRYQLLSPTDDRTEYPHDPLPIIALDFTDEVWPKILGAYSGAPRS